MRPPGIGKVCQNRQGSALRGPARSRLRHTIRTRPERDMPPRHCILSSYACIEVRGADAAAFLHGQLSRSVDSLDVSLAPLAGWHDARGRVRALFRVVRRADAWWLLTQRDVAVSTANRLRMFVLRAAVTIALADEPRVGAVVDADDSWRRAHGLPSDAAEGSVTQVGELSWIRVGP